MCINDTCHIMKMYRYTALVLRGLVNFAYCNYIIEKMYFDLHATIKKIKTYKYTIKRRKFVSDFMKDYHC